MQLLFLCLRKIAADYFSEVWALNENRCISKYVTLVTNMVIL